MERALIEREIARILANMGIREERLSPAARLLQDFRIDGDDAVEFFEAISKRFGTDLTVLRDDWEAHFGPEGASVAPLWMVAAGTAGVGGAAALAGLGPLNGVVLAVLGGAGAWLLDRSGDRPASRPIRLNDVVNAIERGRWERSGG